MTLTDADKAAWAAYERANRRAKLAYHAAPTVTRAVREAIRRDRRDTCGRGHSLVDAYVRTGGNLDCRTCRRERNQRRKAK